MANPPDDAGIHADGGPREALHLRSLRRGLGLSQQQLAARLRVSKLTVLRWEKGRTSPSAEHWQQLLQLQAERDAAGVPERESDPGPADAPQSSTCPLSSFIGRERELTQIGELLRRARLVTLTGPGGCGKTRLAYEAAAHEGTGDRGQGAGNETVRPPSSFAQSSVLPPEAGPIGSPQSSRVVELAALSDATLVPQLVAGAVGVRGQAGRPLLDSLIDALRRKPRLLLLDNCEHLLDACANLVEALLRGCPELRVLATSREPLGLDAEHVWPVPPLSLPVRGDEFRVPSSENRGPPPVQASGLRPLALPESSVLSPQSSDAVRLFVARAQARDPDFRLTGENAAAVVAICRRLDGLPLAIEMAAARVPLLTPHEIAARLDDRFALLSGSRRSAPARHQTLRAALDWSFTLLAAEEQDLLARLSIFPGSFSAEAATAIGGDSAPETGDRPTGSAPGEGQRTGERDRATEPAPSQPENWSKAGRGAAGWTPTQSSVLSPQSSVAPQSSAGLRASLDLLRHLLEKSLVVAEARGRQTRYRLLETVREYARARLKEQGEAERIARFHAEYFLGLVEMAKPELDGGPRQTEWLDRLELELDNLRAALAWGLAQPDAEPATMAMIRLHSFWIIHTHYAEGRTWMGRALVRSDLSGLLRGCLLLTRGELARLLGDYGAAAEDLRRAAALLERESNRRSYANALGTLSLVLHESGAPDAERGIEEALSLFRELEDERNVAALLNTKGLRAIVRGDYAEAEEHFAEAASIFRRGDYRHGLGVVLLNQGLNALGLGDTGLAVAREREAIAVASAIGDRNTVWRARYTLASYAERRAGNLAAAHAGLKELLRLAVDQEFRVGIGRALTGFAMLARDRGDDARAARLWGCADALLLALGDPPRPLFVREWDDEARAEVSAVLGEPVYRAAHAAGAAAPLDAVIAELLAEDSSAYVLPASTPPEPGSLVTDHASRLTIREREVLTLLAEGCSTGEIARRLVLSPRTIERHLANLYAKIGARGRADAIAYAVRREA